MDTAYTWYTYTHTHTIFKINLCPNKLDWTVIWMLFFSIKYSFYKLSHLCVCLYIYIWWYLAGYAPMHVGVSVHVCCTCLWRTEINVLLSFSFFTLFFWDKVSHWSWLANCFQGSPVLGWGCTLQYLFVWLPGIQTQIFPLTMQPF